MVILATHVKAVRAVQVVLATTQNDLDGVVVNVVALRSRSPEYALPIL